MPANLSLIGQGAKDRGYSRVEKQIPAYMGFVFEEMCKQYLWQENLKGTAPVEFSDMGRWWGNDPVRKQQTEIGILADNEDKEAIFAECKWRNEPVGEAELRELAAKMGNVVLTDYEQMEWD